MSRFYNNIPSRIDKPCYKKDNQKEVLTALDKGRWLTAAWIAGRVHMDLLTVRDTLDDLETMGSVEAMYQGSLKFYRKAV